MENLAWFDCLVSIAEYRKKNGSGGTLLAAILCLSGVGDCGEVGDMYDICNTLDMLVGYANILNKPE